MVNKADLVQKKESNAEQLNLDYNQAAQKKKYYW